MASARELLQRGVRVKMLGMGYPKSGKTPSLIPLLLAGYKVRMMDYDDGTASLLRFIPEDQLDKIDLDVVVLKDEVDLQEGKAYASTKGLPAAYKRGWELMREWKYSKPDGTVVNLGKPKDWGPDTILVVDTLTGHGNAAMRRIKSLNSSVQDLRRLSFPAQQEQEAFLDLLTHDALKCHVIIFSHLKVIGPKEPELQKTTGLSPAEASAVETANTIKAENAARQMELVPTRIYPTAVGSALPPHICKALNTVVHYKKAVTDGGRVKRVISWEPCEEMDLAVPAVVKGDNGKPVFEVPQETGLLKIFEAVAGKLQKPAVEQAAPVTATATTTEPAA